MIKRIINHMILYSNDYYVKDVRSEIMQELP